MSISMHIQNLDKFNKRVQDIERKQNYDGRTNQRTDGMTDGMTDNPNPILPPFFSYTILSGGLLD